MTDFKLHHGDCLDVLRTMPDNSIDAVIADPPYGLSDHKPAEVTACLSAWLAGEVYQPKGKGFMSARWDAWVPGPEVWRECLRVLKPGGHMLAFAGTRSMDLMSMAIRLAGFELRDSIGYAHDGGGAPLLAWTFGSGFPKSLDVSKAIDRMAGAEREVVGQGNKPKPTYHTANIGGDATANDYDITAPATEAAKQWEGWGSALKPAWEPILLCRKPLTGTIAENVLEWGTGALNIDARRVGTETRWNKPVGELTGIGSSGEAPKGEGREVTGRWPANFCHDGSQAVLDLFPSDKQGSAARYFYCAKASRADREEGNHHPTVKPTSLLQYLCRLITPTGGVILDPFTGSGSTGKAAMRGGFRFVGIEREEEYLNIARARIEAARTAQ